MVKARKTQTRPYDAADYLKTEEHRAALLEAALEDGHPQVIAMAEEAIARSRDKSLPHDEAWMSGGLRVMTELLPAVDVEALQETQEILADKAFLARLKKSLQQAKEGKTKSLNEVRERLSLKKPGPLPKPICLKGTGPTAADQVLQDRGEAPLHLSPQDQETFVESILNPPPMAPALERAFERRAAFLQAEEEGNRILAPALQKLATGPQQEQLKARPADEGCEPTRAEKVDKAIKRVDAAFAPTSKKLGKK